MIEILPESEGNILGFRASGKLTDQDYRDVLIPRLEETAAEHGKVRFLYYLDEDFEGWEPEAMWDDFKVGVGKIKEDFERFALVGGPKWVEWAMKLDNYLMKAEVKTFPVDQLQEAWDWIRSS